MRKTIIALAGTTALLCGSLVWAAHANSPTSSGASFPHNSPIERIGCTQSGDNCPYGYRIERHGGKGWSLASLGGTKSKDRDTETTMMSITSRGATGNMARNITGPDAIETTTTAIMSRGVTVSIEELRGGSAAYRL